MAYEHGVKVIERPTSLAVPLSGTAGLQVIFGTAPINQATDPQKAVNTLILVNNFAEAQEKLGYSEDYANYTLCQSMDACFKVFNISPVIFCNVLDPAKHKKDNAEATVDVVNSQAVLNEDGILLDSIIITKESNVLVKDTDYILSFDQDGKVIVTMLGAEHETGSISVNSTSIDPTLVTKTDIIGGLDVTTGKETGIELVRKVYPTFNLTPGLLLAPGWSHIPEIGAVLSAKCEEINGVFRCECILDLDTETAKTYEDCLEVKEQSGYSSIHSIITWPKVTALGRKFYYSAVYGALVAYTDAQNDDVPNLSPSNKLIGVTGSVVADGTEIALDQNQAAVLNGNGIVTAINDGGWKSWGNNTACYPENTDPKDRWICCRRFFSWWGNSFILTYKAYVDSPANYRLIETIVDTENIRGNSYVAQGKCAGAVIEFRSEDNPITGILDGKMVFRQFIAPYTPAENIQNILEFDPSMLEAAIGGE